jgi:hypothetical protein
MSEPPDKNEIASLADIEKKYEELDKLYDKLKTAIKSEKEKSIKGCLYKLLYLIVSYNIDVQAYNEAYPNKKVQYAILREDEKLVYYIDYGEHNYVYNVLDEKPYYEYKEIPGGKRLKSKKRTKSRKSKKLKKTRKR